MLARASGAILDFAKRIRSKPLPALMKIYNAKCLPMATYGSDIWGYTDVKEIQGAKNTFLRRLLLVPASTPIFNIHEELGVGFISDQIGAAPLLCWLRIWAQPTPNLSQVIIQDCLLLDKVLDIPWINYIKVQMEILGCPDLFLSPIVLGKPAIRDFKQKFLDRRLTLTEGNELEKPMVRNFIELSLGRQVQPYLTYINNPYHLFVLIRFRHNMVPLLLAFPKDYFKEGTLKPCPCDNFSDQNTLHLIFFCAYYNSLRRKCIIPLLKCCNFEQVRPALAYLQILATPIVCFGVASFLTGAIRYRNRLSLNHPMDSVLNHVS